MNHRRTKKATTNAQSSGASEDIEIPDDVEMDEAETVENMERVASMAMQSKEPRRM